MPDELKNVEQKRVFIYVGYKHPFFSRIKTISIDENSKKNNPLKSPK